MHGAGEDGDGQPVVGGDCEDSWSLGDASGSVCVGGRRWLSMCDSNVGCMGSPE